MKTKSFKRLTDRFLYYDTGIEVTTLLIEKFRVMANSDANLAVALGGNNTDHPNLAKRQNVRKSRNVVGGHLRNMIFGGILKDIYEDFVEYVKETFEEAAQKGIDPARFLSNTKIDLTAKEVLTAGNWEETVKIISEKVFRKIENKKNTQLLIESARDHLNLDVPDALIHAAMPYLGARHILVHRNGIPDDEYLVAYPTVRLLRGKILVDSELITEARTAIMELAKRINDQVIAQELVRPSAMAGHSAVPAPDLEAAE